VVNTRKSNSGREFRAWKRSDGRSGYRVKVRSLRSSDDEAGRVVESKTRAQGKGTRIK
jgi:hypothetical protein